MAAIEGHSSPFNSNNSGTITINIPTMETPPRPSSALARGVQITEFRENRVNPEPIVLEESDFLLEDFLSPRKLRALTGSDNLDDVSYLEMKVDTRETSLGNFGSHLPNLTQLKLSNSVITTIRDLGSCLDDLRVLWMARCGLEDIDGLSSMNNLKELYLSYNEIRDLSACSMLDSLQILDLEGNNIDEIAQVEFLALCSSLSNLTLEGNPVCVTPSPDEASPTYNYRLAVKKVVPQLKCLDDEGLANDESEGRSMASAFDEDWKLLDELMAEISIAGTDEAVETMGRPGTGIKPTTGYRPGSALKQIPSGPPSRSGRPGSGRPGSARPGSGGILRPGSATKRPSSARPMSARSGSSIGSGDLEEVDLGCDASDLTRGGVVCGNPSKALRARQRSKEPSTLKDAPILKEKLRQLPRKENETVLEDDPCLSELVTELNEFKEVHNKKLQELEASKAPQVLKIDYDDAISLSGEEDVESDEDYDEGYGTGKSRQMFEESPSTPPDSRPHSGTKPKTPNVSSFVRGRKYRPAANGDSIQNGLISLRQRLCHDESFEARDEGYSPQSPLSPAEPILSRGDLLRGRYMEPIRPSSPKTSQRNFEEETRSYRTSIAGLRERAKIQSSTKSDTTQPKLFERSGPFIKSPSSPDKPLRSPEGLRSLVRPPNSSGRGMRKGHLANVQLLPSKMPSKFGKP